MSNISIADINGKIIGVEEFTIAIQQEQIRAISRILVFNSESKIFLQKRSQKVRFFQGKWDVSAGGHVDEHETYEEAAKKELREELGVQNVPLQGISNYFHEEKDGNMVLRAYEYIFTTTYDGPFTLNEEVSEGKWFSLTELDQEINSQPDQFTPGLRKALEVLKNVQDSH